MQKSSFYFTENCSILVKLKVFKINWNDENFHQKIKIWSLDEMRYVFYLFLEILEKMGRGGPAEWALLHRHFIHFFYQTELKLAISVEIELALLSFVVHLPGHLKKYQKGLLQHRCCIAEFKSWDLEDDLILVLQGRRHNFFVNRRKP